MKLLPMLLAFTAIASETALAPGMGLGQNGPNKNTTPPPFSISISARPDVMKVGQQLAINVVLTNLSDHSLDTPSVWIEGFDAVYNFDVRDSTGTQLPWHAPPWVAHFDAIRSGKLDPGGAKGEQLVISDFYNLTKPGAYEIQAWRYIDVENPQGETVRKPDIAKGVVWSNKITLTVIPATTTAPQ